MVGCDYIIINAESDAYTASLSAYSGMEDIRGHFPSSPIQLCLFSFIPISNITYNISTQASTKNQSKFSENFRSVDL